MTAAVCFKCGAMKLGAFTQCDACGGSPQTEDERALSWALSDKLLDADNLQRMSVHVASGKSVELDEGSRQNIIQAIRAADQQIKRKAMQIKRSAASTPGKASCFPSSSRVLTPHGSVPIVKLNIGDTVLSLSPEAGLVEAHVTQRVCYAATKLLQINFEGGPPLVTTHHHTLLTTQGWCRVGRLLVGDEVRRAVEPDAQRFLTILSFNDGGFEPVYNLHTTGPHNFIVDGYLAHNFTTFRRLRTLIHRVVVDPTFNGALRSRKVLSITE